MKTTIETKNEQTASATLEQRDVVAPRCDIFENDKSIHVLAEMPGVDAQSVEVTLERNLLTIRGTAKAVEPEGFRLLWREFDSVDYRRSFELSSEADSSAIRASILNGILRIEVPKTTPVQRKIPVKVS